MASGPCFPAGFSFPGLGFATQNNSVYFGANSMWGRYGCLFRICISGCTGLVGVLGWFWLWVVARTGHVAEIAAEPVLSYPCSRCF